MKLLFDLQDSILKNINQNAFYINGRYFTYSYFSLVVSKIRKAIQKETANNEKNVGLIINDDIETYASIIALWFEGKAYVPINPDTPRDRNYKIFFQADIKTIIDSSEKLLFSEYNLIVPERLNETGINLIPIETQDSEIAYILFTSGTTGEPKGVPITRANVAGFIAAFHEIGFNIDKNDRVLQMFELTFDFSVMSYLVPLLSGACIYTIPKNKIKYNYIYELMDEHNLTVALMVPSILHYLRQYFDEISAPNMKYSLLGGEAVPLDITEEWSRCLPNADIYNIYGPTESTIFCTTYKFKRSLINKEHNGILSIGKAMTGVITIIADENNNILHTGEKGELCLAGELLTPGYLKNENKNKEAFFVADYKGKSTKFYKTGDLCLEDSDGDILYLGRIDFQTKIQGFRVELSEIEFHVKAFLGKTNAVAVAVTNKIGNTEIGLVIESNEFIADNLFDYLKTKIPVYMIPTQLKFIDVFPLSLNGKIDRKILSNLFKN